MDSVLSQLHAEANMLLLTKPIQGPRELLRNKRLLGVKFENEPGQGPGPLKEFIDYCSKMFSSQPVTDIYASDLWKKSKSSFIGKFMFVSKFPFFSLVPGEGKQVRPRIIEEVARVPIPDNLLERLTNLMPAEGYTLAHTLFGSHMRVDKKGNKTADKRVTRIRRIFVGLGVILGHCYREGGSIGVDFPQAIWAFLLGHPPSSDWRYYCSGDGEDAARIRGSIEYILSVDDVADLGLEFTAPITTRIILADREQVITKDYTLRCETTPIMNTPLTTWKGNVNIKEEGKEDVESKTPIKNSRKYRSGNKTKTNSSNKNENGNNHNDNNNNYVDQDKSEQLKEKESEPPIVTTTTTANVTPTTTPKTPAGIVPVTNANRHEYVLRWARSWCFQGCEESLVCMKLGLDRTMPPDLLRTLDAAHMRLFMRGATSVNVEELRLCVKYNSPYYDGHRMILMFWKCMEELTDEQRGKLLQFWTGSIVPPYSGFMADAVRDSGIEGGDLRISKIWKAGVSSENTIGHLPEATTCNKELYLPEYDSMKTLRRALLNALEFSSKGFDRA